MKHTPAQLAVINSNAASILCVSGPGSGKSSTVVARIQRLLADGVKPAQIACLSFTNAASDVLQERIGDVRLGVNSTLHGFALRMLKAEGEGIGFGARLAIVNEDATESLIEGKAQSLNCKTPLKKLLKLKQEGIARIAASAAGVSVRLSLDEMVIKGYYQDLREAGLVDFDSILAEFSRLLDWLASPVCTYDSAIYLTHLFVDEVQDSSAIDWEIFRKLRIANKCFIGDGDQAIFGFRGGRPELMQEYAQQGGVEVFKLEDNFRSKSEICRVAQQLIERNTQRIRKETKSAVGPGGWVQHFAPSRNEGEEQAVVIRQVMHLIGPARFDEVDKWTVVPEEIAILTRKNALAHEFREALKAAGIQVAEPPKSDKPMDWRKCRALVDLLVNPDNDTLASFYLGTIIPRRTVHAHLLGARSAGVSLNRYLAQNGDLGFKAANLVEVAVMLAREGISTESRMLVAEKIKALPAGATVLDLSLLLALNDDAKTERTKGVFVSTIHKSKGLEFDVVFLAGLEDEVMPGKKEAEVEESRRLCYVGVTRARTHVYLSWAQSRRTEWGVTFGKASRFIQEMLA